MSNNNFRSSERGSILLGALVIALLVGVFSGVIASQIKDTSDLSQIPRIRAAMAQTELQLRALAMSPASYECLQDVGPTECTLKTAAFLKLKTDFPEGTVEATYSYAKGTTRFVGGVAYVPKDVSKNRFQLRSRDVDLEIPSEILQKPKYVCPATAPLFAGYEATGATKGKPICKTLSPIVCATGKYVANIKPATLEPVCEDAGRVVTCLDSEYLDTFSWDGGALITSTCAPRKDPFGAEMGWTVTPIISLTYNSQDPDTPDPAPAALPASQIVTWTAPATEPPNACYTPPAIDCVGSFGACSAPCGGGTQIYGITTYASNGGMACPNTQGQTIACNTQACTVPPSGPTGCYDNFEVLFAYQSDCLGNIETLNMSCPAGQGADQSQYGTPTSPAHCGSIPNNSVWAPAKCRTCTPAPAPSTCTWIPGASNNNVQPPHCTSGIAQDINQVGPEPTTCTTSSNALSIFCWDGNIRTAYQCTCGANPPSCPAGTSTTGAGDVSSDPSCRCTNAGETWNGASCVAAAPTCRNDILYHPCRNTGCNTVDFQCPIGQVFNRYATGNVWGGSALITWTGGLASKCVAPAACVPTALPKPCGGYTHMDGGRTWSPCGTTRDNTATCTVNAWLSNFPTPRFNCKPAGSPGYPDEISYSSP